MNAGLQILITLIAAVIITGGIFALSLVLSGERAYGLIENIDGVPFTVANEATLVTEKLAHLDVYLREPALFKRLVITVEFDPQNLRQLDVGVREGEFWLSYPRHTIYDALQHTSGRKSITIPINLTDKLQDSDRSVDVMFFAAAEGATSKEDEGVDDTALWELYNFTAHTEFTFPTTDEMKDYIRSVIKRERPL
ncbi:MAG: hypothetical protein WD200_03740 [Candidatus Andersenbacteria bacterium]